MAYPYYYQQFGNPNPYQSQSYLPQNYQPVQQTAIPQSSIIWVSGEQEAAMYPIAPNNAVALWDKSGNAVFLKQADATGKPSMVIYNLEKRDETHKNQLENVDSIYNEFAKKSDFAAVNDTISSIKAEIDVIKSDLYGVAGRKRSKKTEVNDDDE